MAGGEVKGCMEDKKRKKANELHRKYRAKWKREFFDGRRCQSCGSPKDLLAIDTDGKAIVHFYRAMMHKSETCKIFCHACRHPLVHGTQRAYYVRGCRCEICSNSISFNARMRQKRQEFIKRTHPDNALPR